MKKAISRIILFSITSIMIFQLSGCGISQTEYDEAVAAAEESGYDIGYEEGYEAGYDQGYYDGEENGKSIGAENGYADGYTEGYEQGFSEAVGITSDPVYITLTGTKYHRASCSYLSDSAVMTSRSAAIADGYTACSRCNP